MTNIVASLNTALTGGQAVVGSDSNSTAKTSADKVNHNDSSFIQGKRTNENSEFTGEFEKQLSKKANNKEQQTQNDSIGSSSKNTPEKNKQSQASSSEGTSDDAKASKIADKGNGVALENALSETRFDETNPEISLIAGLLSENPTIDVNSINNDSKIIDILKVFKADNAQVQADFDTRSFKDAVEALKNTVGQVGIIAKNLQHGQDKPAMANIKQGIPEEQSSLDGITPENLGTKKENSLINQAVQTSQAPNAISRSDNKTSEKVVFQEANTESQQDSVFKAAGSGKMNKDAAQKSNELNQSLAMAENATKPEYQIIDAPQKSVEGHGVSTDLKADIAVPVESFNSSDIPNSNTVALKDLAVSGQEIVRQVSEKLQVNFNSSDNNVTIALDPPELGKIQVRIIERGGEVTGILQVERSDVKQEIERELPAVMSSIQNAGVQVKRVEVALNQPGTQDSFSGSDYSDANSMMNSDQETMDQHSKQDTVSLGNKEPEISVTESEEDSINIYM